MLPPAHRQKKKFQNQNLQFSKLQILMKLSLSRCQSLTIKVQDMHTTSLLQRSDQTFIWFPLLHQIIQCGIGNIINLSLFQWQIPRTKIHWYQSSWAYLQIIIFKGLAPVSLMFECNDLRGQLSVPSQQNQKQSTLM